MTPPTMAPVLVIEGIELSDEDVEVACVSDGLEKVSEAEVDLAEVDVVVGVIS